MGLYYALILPVIFFCFTIYPVYFSVSGEIFASFFLKAVCDIRKWFLKDKTWRMHEIRKAKGWFFKDQSLGKEKQNWSPWLYLLTFSLLLCFRPCSLSLLPHFSHPNLQSHSVSFVLSCPWRASFFMPKQLIKYFPKESFMQRKIIPLP